ncbi:MAG: hypothetical protein JJU15_00180 [Pararhodobacter sp.]|nr:hypothetical protein [Pararhodobacter sp.]
MSALAQATAPLSDPWYMPATQRAAQFADFQRDERRSVIDFQPFRAEAFATLPDGTPLRLTALNPRANAWFVLETGNGNGARSWHLENAAPGAFTIALGQGDAPAIEIISESGRNTCRPWEGELEAAARSGLPYAPICEQQIYLRNRGSGSRTAREAMAEFLRGYVPFGESIITLIKDTLYEDAYLQTSEALDEAEAGAVVAALGRAQLRAHPVMRSNLQVDLIGTDGGRMEAGSWYAVQDAPGVYASVMQPGMVHPDILNRPGEANGLDGVENSADVHLFAFDLNRFELGYELGSDHPAITWSPRPSGAGRTGLPGPDGFNTLQPLAMTGMLSPVMTDRVAAIFAGGFKREHAAFRAGPMSQSNSGHHYGFVVQGVILSRLQPGLATIFTLDDGSIHMRTWAEDDNALLPRIRFARQNGVALIEPGADGAPVAGQHVRSWMLGNWSGSAEAQLRTLRAGACMREADGRQVLIYAVFSSATPSGMTRSFQAYGCDHAMLLDMNSLDLTYAAIYTRRPGEEGFQTFHLDRRMAESDTRQRDGTAMARFVEYSDNRDFIYLLRRQGRE